MTTPLDPRVSEFETREQADSHEGWVRAQVCRALDDTRPYTTHDDVMAEMDMIIDTAERRGKPQR